MARGAAAVARPHPVCLPAWPGLPSLLPDPSPCLPACLGVQCWCQLDLAGYFGGASEEEEAAAGEAGGGGSPEAAPGGEPPAPPPALLRTEALGSGDSSATLHSSSGSSTPERGFASQPAFAYDVPQATGEAAEAASQPLAEHDLLGRAHAAATKLKAQALSRLEEVARIEQEDTQGEAPFRERRRTRAPVVDPATRERLRLTRVKEVGALPAACCLPPAACSKPAASTGFEAPRCRRVSVVCPCLR